MVDMSILFFICLINLTPFDFEQIKKFYIFG